MLTITAVFKSKPGFEDQLRDALLTAAEFIQDNEADTISFYLSQDTADPSLFITHERFTDQAAMDRHNNSEAVAAFFASTKKILDGEVTVVTATELSAKR